MTYFLANLVLALVWWAAAGRTDPEPAAVGFVVGYVVLRWLQPVLGRSGYFRKLPAALMLAVVFAYELVVSSIRVAGAVLAPRARCRPGFVAVPLAATTDAEITLLANLVTLTPGTLSLDVSSDRRTLHVHAMFLDDADALCAGIKDQFERRILELLR